MFGGDAPTRYSSFRLGVYWSIKKKLKGIRCIRTDWTQDRYHNGTGPTGSKTAIRSGNKKKMQCTGPAGRQGEGGAVDGCACTGD